MTIQGPQFDPLYRVQPIDHSTSDEDKKERKKRRSVYQGRSWGESDEELPIEDKIPKKAFKEEGKKKSKPIFIEAVLLEKAHKLFEKLTTLEDKVAQLFFYKTEASYDPEIQNELSHLISQWQIGGLLFLQGSYKREAYLIEHYQKFAKLPLLIGNDFLHNLTFYFQEDFPQENPSSQYCRDLGKAVMGQNRSLGVHFLFDRESGERLPAFPLDEEQKQSFRKGFRQAQGVVARDLLPSKGIRKIKETDLTVLKTVAMPIAEILKEKSAEQFIGMRTLFLRESITDKAALIEAFEQGYEAFLIKEDLSTAIEGVASAVREGLISEEELDKRVLKILIIKAYSQN